MSVKKFTFSLIMVSFTVILLLVFKYVPASSIPFIKNYVPIIYTNNEEPFQNETENSPNIILHSEGAAEKEDSNNYTASQYHNFEKIIDELIIETKEN